MMFRFFKKRKSQNPNSIELRDVAKDRDDEEKIIRRFFTKNRVELLNSWRDLVLEKKHSQSGVVDWDNKVLKMLLDQGVSLNHHSKNETALFVTYLTNKCLNQEYLLEQQRMTTSKLSQVNLPKNPIAYENMCADILRGQGWQTKTTSGSGDQGVDVWAYKSGIRIVLQCKLYSKPVGNKAVQEALSGMAFEQANFAVVVAPNGFTRSAKQLAQRTGALLLSEKDLHLVEQCVG